MLAAFAAGDRAAAAEQGVPLPPPRPAVVAPATAGDAAASSKITPDGGGDAAGPPSACDARLGDEGAEATVLPPLVGPGGCGAPDVVRLDAVRLADRSRVTLSPAPILRCPMAEAVTGWVRADVAPHAAALGSVLKAIETYDSYECRGRNNIQGAKLSEHGKANALDVHALKLANGTSVDLTDIHVAQDLREALRTSACARFTTVLGPGSDGYHENHVHIDLAERHNGYRICQWDIRTPELPGAVAQAAQAAQPARATQPAQAAETPLPRPRPAEADAAPEPPARHASSRHHHHRW